MLTRLLWLWLGGSCGRGAWHPALLRDVGSFGTSAPPVFCRGTSRPAQLLGAPTSSFPYPQPSPAGAVSSQTQTTRYPKLVPLTLEIPVLYVKHSFIFNKVNVLFLKQNFFVDSS